MQLAGVHEKLLSMQSRPRILIIDPSPLLCNVFQLVIGRGSEYVLDVESSLLAVDPLDLSDDFYKLLLVGSDTLQEYVRQKGELPLDHIMKVCVAKPSDLGWVELLGWRNLKLLARPFQPDALSHLVDALIEEVCV